MKPFFEKSLSGLGRLTARWVEGRSLWIDVLRGIAIMLVLYHHGAWAPGAMHPGYNTLTLALHTVGWAGVDLFFALSGFLIGSLIFREYRERSEVDYPRFFVRRLFRIFPAYFPLLFFILWMPTNRNVSFDEFWPSFIFIQNFTETFPPNVRWGHTWSLCIEEHFYLGFPLVFWFLTRFRRVWITPIFILSLIPISLVLRVWYLEVFPLEPDPAQPPGFLFYTFNRLEGIAMGLFIAYAKLFKVEAYSNLARRRKTIFLCSLLFLWPMGSLIFYKSYFMMTLGFTLTSFGMGGLVFLAATAGKPGLIARLIWGPLALIGVISYSLYLTHPMVFMLDYIKDVTLVAHSHLHQFFMPLLGVRLAPLYGYFCVAILFAAAYALIFERPALWLRNKLFP